MMVVMVVVIAAFVYCAILMLYLIKSSQQSIKINFTHLLQRKYLISRKLEILPHVTREVVGIKTTY